MISNLSITNFKCFKNIDVPLSPLTILSGGNGVGKSSIIQALLLLRQSADQLRLLERFSVPSSDAIVEFPVRLNGAYHLALGNSGVVTNAEVEAEEIKLGIQSKKGEKESSISETFIADTVGQKTTLLCRHSLDNTNLMLDQSGSCSIFCREFHYLIAERNGPRNISGVSDSHYISTGFSGEFTADAIDRAENQQVNHKIAIDEKSPLFKVQLESWMRKLVPGVSFATQRYQEINRVSLGISTINAMGQFSPTNTGFGISYSLPVVVSGLLAKPGSLMIVENPEAHLHPSAQSAIGYFLAVVASTGVQVLVETHSENVINGVRLAAIEEVLPPEDASFIFLSLVQGDTQPHIDNLSVSGLGELNMWPTGFFDQQEKDLFKLTRARREKKKNQ